MKRNVIFTQFDAYKAPHKKLYSADTMQLIDAHNKIEQSCLPKRPNVWNDEEWKKYLIDKKANFTYLLNQELTGMPEPENYMRAAKYRDHLSEIQDELDKVK